MPGGNNRSHALNKPANFTYDIYDPFLPPDINGRKVRRYLSLVDSTWSFSNAFLSADFFLNYQLNKNLIISPKYFVTKLST